MERAGRSATTVGRTVPHRGDQPGGAGSGRPAVLQDRSRTRAGRRTGCGRADPSALGGHCRLHRDEHHRGQRHRQQFQHILGACQNGSNSLAYLPKSSFTAWSTWKLPAHFTLGAGARYSGEMQRGHDGAVGTPEFTQAYWVFNAMASYAINRHTSLQLNVYNLFDKHYACGGILGYACFRIPGSTITRCSRAPCPCAPSCRRACTGMPVRTAACCWRTRKHESWGARADPCSD